ncbi:hypothetical protein [Spiroplasma endosymbiont of Cantharis lateralis]|uniref:hypothetical protein n=1 Tax=Spiroplasma endosymbiont of Cantharis lateralis TaxID=3066277 RepID=UPI00313B9170
MGSKYNKRNAKKRFYTESFTEKEQSIIALSVDVRNSTQMKSQIGNEKTIEVIKPFIEECFILLKNRGCFYNYIYAGDGIIAICNVNNNNENFTNVYHCAIDINSYIKNFKTWVNEMYNYGFNAGIGIAWDAETYIEKIKNMPGKINNVLYVGNSISKASKLSGITPKKVSNVTYNIAVTRNFYSKLIDDDKKDFKYKSKKFNFTNISWKE